MRPCCRCGVAFPRLMPRACCTYRVEKANIDEMVGGPDRLGSYGHYLNVLTVRLSLFSSALVLVLKY